MTDIQLLTEVRALKAHSEGIVALALLLLHTEDPHNDIECATQDLAFRLEKLFWELQSRLAPTASVSPSANEVSSNG